MFEISYTATLKWVGLCLATVSISNCMTSTAKYPEILLDDRSKAMVVVYRPPTPITVPQEYVEWPPGIYHDSKKLVELEPNSYTRIEIEPGLTIFSARTKVGAEIQGTVNVNAKSGRHYFLRYVPFRYRGLLPADSYEFKMVRAGFAREELRGARYLPPVE